LSVFWGQRTPKIKENGYVIAIKKGRDQATTLGSKKILGTVAMKFHMTAAHPLSGC